MPLRAGQHYQYKIRENLKHWTPESAGYKVLIENHKIYARESSCNLLLLVAASIELQASRSGACFVFGPCRLYPNLKYPKLSCFPQLLLAVKKAFALRSGTLNAPNTQREYLRPIDGRAEQREAPGPASGGHLASRKLLVLERRGIFLELSSWSIRRSAYWIEWCLLACCSCKWRFGLDCQGRGSIERELQSDHSRRTLTFVENEGASQFQAFWNSHKRIKQVSYGLRLRFSNYTHQIGEPEWVTFGRNELRWIQLPHVDMQSAFFCMLEVVNQWFP